MTAKTLLGLFGSVLRIQPVTHTKKTPQDCINSSVDKRKLQGLVWSTVSTMTNASATKGESTKEAQNEANPNISKMALYNLSRAKSVLTSLSDKPKWTNADTSSFDCMHYDGDTALDHCASKLGLQADEHVLDIGSGFNATGRFLASKYGARVTGIELQRENHELAQRITTRNVDPRVVERVRSVNADFLSLTPESLIVGNEGPSSSIRFDQIISLLCITHIPESARPALFRQAARFLKPGGKMYIEDFYDKSCTRDTVSHITRGELHQLEEIMACPYLPSASKFIADVTSAGFDSVEFEDVSKVWTPLLRARSEKYKVSEKPISALQRFYDTVAEVFDGGNVGGLRLSAVRR